MSGLTKNGAAMALAIYQVDACMSQPFQGNPTGLVITEKPLTETLMMFITRALAVSETARTSTLGLLKGLSIAFTLIELLVHSGQCFPRYTNTTANSLSLAVCLE